MRRDVWLWFANFLGPITWFVLLSTAFYVVPGAHESGRVWTVRGMHGAALVLVIVSIAIAVRELKLGAGDTSDVMVQRRRFLALSALGVSAISLLIVIGMSLTTLLLQPGAEP